MFFYLLFNIRFLYEAMGIQTYYADGENEDTIDELNELGEEGWD